MGQKKTATILNIIFTIAVILLLVIFFIKKDYIYIAEVGAAYIGYLCLIYFERKKNFIVENYIRTLVIITVAANGFIGEYLNLYNTTQYFDKALHFFGTFSFSLLAYSLINKNIIHIPGSRYFTIIFIASIGAFIGDIFELGEFLIDVVLKTKNQQSLIETDLDILFNLIGSVLAGFFIAFKKSSA